ncbi:MAG: type II toxin-antitoxin system VapB family antitoxin [Actinobacteria bacterium]|nr:type II toxin-antitoxin system VapB family antitoxin [Actinomycetota bacterium]
MKRTTVVLDEQLLKRAMEVTQAKTKKEAIEKGLKELIRRKNAELLREELGTYDIALTPEELERLRDEG